jgi:hypothetical protein
MHAPIGEKLKIGSCVDYLFPPMTGNEVLPSPPPTMLSVSRSSSTTSIVLLDTVKGTADLKFVNMVISWCLVGLLRVLAATNV